MNISKIHSFSGHNMSFKRVSVPGSENIQTKYVKALRDSKLNPEGIKFDSDSLSYTFESNSDFQGKRPFDDTKYDMKFFPDGSIKSMAISSRIQRQDSFRKKAEYHYHQNGKPFVGIEYGTDRTKYNYGEIKEISVYDKIGKETHNYNYETHTAEIPNGSYEWDTVARAFAQHISNLK